MSLLIVLLTLVPNPAPVCVDSVEIAELNHVLCPLGNNEQGCYWIWWKWQTVDGVADYYVSDWRRWCDAPAPQLGVQEFWDSKTKVNRKVHSRIYVETWTFYDKETHDRKRLPEASRRKLSGKD